MIQLAYDFYRLIKLINKTQDYRRRGKMTENHYKVGTHVLIKHGFGISLGEVISSETVREKLGEEAVIYKDKIPVKWGVCIASYVQWFTQEELDLSQEKVIKEPLYKKAIQEFSKNTLLNLTEIHISKNLT